MTSKELNDIEALEKRVAVEVMGWTYDGFCRRRPVYGGWDLPRFSTDITDAFKVVKQMRKLGFSANLGLESINISSYRATFMQTGEKGVFDTYGAGDSSHISLEDAICRAALSAVEAAKERK